VVKTNSEILGNRVSHLHCYVYVVPRHDGDPAPGRPINPHPSRLGSTPEEHEQRIGLIRSAPRQHV
jgi:hypothetical protein